MKAAIYNPYLDSLGGGERYSLAVALWFVKAGYEVDLQWKDELIKEKLRERFGINLEGINIVNGIRRGDSYDVCFWVSDGSVPLLRSRYNILHFQIPFINIDGRSLLNRMKLLRINKVVCNSNFTKSFIDREYGVDSLTVYPPVDGKNIKPKRKLKMILSVGRFSQLAQAKRQDILVRAFKKLYDKGLKEWKLILAGGVEVGTKDYLKRLKKLSKGYPVEIYQSPNFRSIRDLYGQAKLFWTASGYGINEESEPLRVEHFGIAVVESMAAKAVPFAYQAGGHKEIIKEGKNGFLWSSISELVEKTYQVIKEPRFLSSIARNAKKRSKNFSYEKFDLNFSQVMR